MTRKIENIDTSPEIEVMDVDVVVHMSDQEKEDFCVNSNDNFIDPFIKIDVEDILLELFLALKSKSVPEATLNLISEEMERFYHIMKLKLKTMLNTDCKEMSERLIEGLDRILPDGLFAKFETSYKRIKTFKLCAEYIELGIHRAGKN